jgi:hypothetical protein
MLSEWRFSFAPVAGFSSLHRLLMTSCLILPLLGVSFAHALLISVPLFGCVRLQASCTTAARFNYEVL